MTKVSSAYCVLCLRLKLTGISLGHITYIADYDIDLPKGTLATASKCVALMAI